jgi:hypothetical protein
VKYRLGDQPEAGGLQLGGQVPQFGGYGALVDAVGGASNARSARRTQLRGVGSTSRGGSGGGGSIRPGVPRNIRTSIP